jgi:transposase
MAMGKRGGRQRQEGLWIPSNDIVQTPGHVFYNRLNEVLAKHRFDERVERLCRRFYKGPRGQPSLPPGIYFRCLLLGFFEGLDSERGIAWRVADSLSIRKFLGYGIDEKTPDHSTISRTRRLFWLSTHRTVFRWVLRVLKEEGLLKGKTIGIDATTLEANAALRSIVRRDTSEPYTDYITRLAQAAGLEEPTREQLARFDRKRKKKGSNKDWKHPDDPDARITKMKDGRTHLAHKAEHAVDLSSGALLEIALHPADAGDTTTGLETLAAAQRNATAVGLGAIQEAVLDKGYHSNAVLVTLADEQVRSYVSEPKGKRRRWGDKPEAQGPLYGNRRRLRGRRNKRLQAQRAELCERSNAHLYETGGMRRLYLRGRENILKRLLIHAAGFDLALLMRKLYGVGTPRGLQGATAWCFSLCMRLRLSLNFIRRALLDLTGDLPRNSVLSAIAASQTEVQLKTLISTTGC